VKTAPLLAAVCALLAGAAPAQAALVYVDASNPYLYPKVVFAGAPGEQNAVTAQFVLKSGIAVIVQDKTAIVTAGAGCLGGVHWAICTNGIGAQKQLARVEVFAGDRNDTISVKSGPATVHGGDGNDVITTDTWGEGILADVIGAARYGEDELYGDAGSDTLGGGKGVDYIAGGPGNDALYAGADGAWMEGGPGADLIHGNLSPNLVDFVNYDDRTAPVSVTLNGIADDGESGERDNVTGVTVIRGGRGDDTLRAGDAAAGGSLADYSLGGLEGNDLLIGGAARDWIGGGAGNDVLRGNAGRDDLFGGSGDDTLFARDGERDRLSCDLGSDSAQIDVGLDYFEFTPVAACETLLP
jgi:Ca2+-binding RTX toxin-like protein